MTAIWHNDAEGWKLLPPSGFPDEATLHALIDEAPQLLPLSGNPGLIILGREVSLGSGYADLVGIEPTGRLVILEVKLARNAEARRAVVSQVLAYAAHLHRLAPEALESEILSRHLRQRNFECIRHAVESADQVGAFDSHEFAEGLAHSLAEGRFRVVIVLDEAPEELVRLVGYLESVSDKLVIDLVTVSSYRLGDSTVLVPQRIDPERQADDTRSPIPARPRGRLVDGAQDFLASIATANEAERPKLQRLAEWAQRLEADGLVQLSTYHGTSQRWTLLPRLRAENVGLVTIWNDNRGSLQFWRSVFERNAPNSLARLDALIAPETVRQGNIIYEINDDLLNALTEAYREATAPSDAHGRARGQA